jgi:hypothetical protein
MAKTPAKIPERPLIERKRVDYSIIFLIVLISSADLELFSIM